MNGAFYQILRNENKTMKNLDLKAVIVAAGIGQRLDSLTKNIPKPLLQFRDGQSILEYTLLSMNEANLFNKVVIVTGYMHSKVRNTIESIKPKIKFEIDYIFNPQYDTKSVLYSVEKGIGAVGDGDICLMNGDTIFSVDVFNNIRQTLLNRGIPKGSVIGSCKNESTINNDDIKVHVGDLNRVLRVGKNLKYANAVSSGIIFISSIMRAQYSEKLSELKSSNRVAHHDIIDSLCQDGVPITFIQISPYDWAEVDTLYDYEKAKELFRRR